MLSTREADDGRGDLTATKRTNDGRVLFARLFFVFVAVLGKWAECAWVQWIHIQYNLQGRTETQHQVGDR